MIFHEFYLADVEDPYLYAGFPIGEWAQTEHGKWVMENAIEEPVFHVMPDPNTMGYRVIITGDLHPEAATYFTLKFK